MNDNKDLTELFNMSTKQLKEVLPFRLDIPPDLKQMFLRAAATKEALKKERVSKAVAAMIGFRQAYIVGYRELLEAAEEEGITDEITDELLRNVWAVAAKPFNEHDLMQSMMGQSLPSLAEIVDKHAEVDKHELLRLKEEAEEERRQSVIPFPFLVSSETTGLSRIRSITYLAHKDTAFRLAREVIAAVKTEKPDLTILLLCRQKDDAEVIAGEHKLPFIAGEAWEGVCSNRQLAQGKLDMLVSLAECFNGVDLIICMDLAHGHKSTFTQRPREAAAGDCHRGLWEFCKRKSCGLLGFVIGGEEEKAEDYKPNSQSQFLDQLRLFSQLETISYDGGQFVCSPYNHPLSN